MSGLLGKTRHMAREHKDTKINVIEIPDSDDEATVKSDQSSDKSESIPVSDGCVYAREDDSMADGKR